MFSSSEPVAASRDCCRPWNTLSLCLPFWAVVYDSCHTFLHVVRVRKHTDMRELHAKSVQFSHVSVFSETRAILSCQCVFWFANVQKRVTKSDTLGHCLGQGGACQCVFWIAPCAKTCYKIWYLGPLPRAGWWWSGGQGGVGGWGGRQGPVADHSYSRKGCAPVKADSCRIG